MTHSAINAAHPVHGGYTEIELNMHDHVHKKKGIPFTFYAKIKSSNDRLWTKTGQ